MPCINFIQLWYTERLNIHTYAILPPNQAELKRIQCRSFVRVQTAIDVAVHCTKKSTTPFPAFTTNISGEGLACILPPQIVLEENQRVSLFMVLQTELTCIQTHARVVYIQLIKHGTTICSLEFIRISEKDRHAIIQHGFDIPKAIS